MRYTPPVICNCADVPEKAGISVRDKKSCKVRDSVLLWRGAFNRGSHCEEAAGEQPSGREEVWEKIVERIEKI